jgi:uncharacterized membrane protein
MTELTLRPLTVGEMIDHSLKVYRRSFGPMVLIALLANVVPTVLGVYIVMSGGVRELPVLWGANLVLSIVMGAIATAATVFLVSESYLGRQIGAGDAIIRAFKFIWPLIVLSIGVGLAVMVGFILLIIPGIIIACGLMVSTQALVLEDVTATEAMSRSWNLTKGFRMKLFGLVFLVFILILIPSIVIGFFTTPTQPDLTDLEALRKKIIVASVIQQVVTVILYPLLYCALTIAYYDLRIRKEGFDLELLESTLQHPALPGRASGTSDLPKPRSFG